MVWQSQADLYFGAPSDLAWICSLTLAVSSGKVATSAVHAAIALLMNVAQIGRGLVGCVEPVIGI